VWGSKAILGHMVEFFKGIFHDHGLVDIVPIKYVPTWCNRRGGSKSIEKRLDRVFMSEDIVSSVRRYKS